LPNPDSHRQELPSFLGAHSFIISLLFSSKTTLQQNLKIKKLKGWYAATSEFFINNFFLICKKNEIFSN